MPHRRAMQIGSMTFCLLLAVLTLFMMISSYKGVIVVSDSMSPAIPKWSMAIVAQVNPQSVRAGDIILFMDPHQSRLVLHRVVKLEPQAQNFMTRGDRNGQSDLYPVPWIALRGRYVTHLPVIGWVVFYAKQYMLLLASGLLIYLSVSIARLLFARTKVEP